MSEVTPLSQLRVTRADRPAFRGKLLVLPGHIDPRMKAFGRIQHPHLLQTDPMLAVKISAASPGDSSPGEIAGQEEVNRFPERLLRRGLWRESRVGCNRLRSHTLQQIAFNRIAAVRLA
jgi:hypothetical protein